MAYKIVLLQQLSISYKIIRSGLWHILYLERLLSMTPEIYSSTPTWPSRFWINIDLMYATISGSERFIKK